MEIVSTQFNKKYKEFVQGSLKMKNLNRLGIIRVLHLRIFEWSSLVSKELVRDLYINNNLFYKGGSNKKPLVAKA